MIWEEDDSGRGTKSLEAEEENCPGQDRTGQDMRVKEGQGPGKSEGDDENFAAQFKRLGLGFPFTATLHTVHGSEEGPPSLFEAHLRVPNRFQFQFGFACPRFSQARVVTGCQYYPVFESAYAVEKEHEGGPRGAGRPFLTALCSRGVVCLAAVRGRRYSRLQLGDTDAGFHMQSFVVTLRSVMMLLGPRVLLLSGSWWRRWRIISLCHPTDWSLVKEMQVSGLGRSGLATLVDRSNFLLAASGDGQQSDGISWGLSPGVLLLAIPLFDPFKRSYEVRRRPSPRGTYSFAPSIYRLSLRSKPSWKTAGLF
ncbi:hypothetical protein V8E52_008151 [Russula decolorans]